VSGVFVTFEGIDGCSKSTQLEILAERLRADGHEVVTTKEPGAARGGDKIRELLFKDPSTNKMARGQGDCLFLYDHIGNVEEHVRPALERGAWVLCDRYADSQFAYASVPTRNASPVLCEAYQKLYGPVPDITLLFVVKSTDVNEAGDEDISWALKRAMARRGAEAGKQEGKKWGTDVEEQRRIQYAYIMQLCGKKQTVLIDVYPHYTVEEIAETVYSMVQWKLRLLEQEEKQLVLPGNEGLEHEARQ
jgi:dTMP kinase